MYYKCQICRLDFEHFDGQRGMQVLSQRCGWYILLLIGQQVHDRALTLSQERFFGTIVSLMSDSASIEVL